MPAKENGTTETGMKAGTKTATSGKDYCFLYNPENGNGTPTTGSKAQKDYGLAEGIERAVTEFPGSWRSGTG